MPEKKRRPSAVSNNDRLLDAKDHYNLDAAIREIGGFGIYQYLLVTCLIIMRNGGNYMYYSFGLLIMQNDYLCRNTPDELWATCSVDEMCTATGAKFESKVDINGYQYVYNWLNEMDMVCAP